MFETDNKFALSLNYYYKLPRVRGFYLVQQKIFTYLSVEIFSLSYIKYLTFKRLNNLSGSTLDLFSEGSKAAPVLVALEEKCGSMLRKNEIINTDLEFFET